MANSIPHRPSVTDRLRRSRSADQTTFGAMQSVAAAFRNAARWYDRQQQRLLASGVDVPCAVQAEHCPGVLPNYDAAEQGAGSLIDSDAARS